MGSFYLRPKQKCSKVFEIAKEDCNYFTEGVHKIGAICLEWKRQFSSIGRLQSAVLETTRSGNLELNIETPEKVDLLSEYDITLKLVNTNKVTIDVNLELEKMLDFNQAVHFIGELRFDNILLSPGEEHKISSKFLASRRGPQFFPSIKATSGSHVFQYKNIKKVVVC